MHVFASLVPFCDVLYDFCDKKKHARFVLIPIYFVWGSDFIYVIFVFIYVIFVFIYVICIYLRILDC